MGYKRMDDPSRRPEGEAVPQRFLCVARPRGGFVPPSESRLPGLNIGSAAPPTTGGGTVPTEYSALSRGTL